MKNVIVKKVDQLFRYRRTIFLVLLILFFLVPLTTYVTGRSIYFLNQRKNAIIVGLKIENILTKILRDSAKSRFLFAGDRNQHDAIEIAFKIRKELEQLDKFVETQMTAVPFPFGSYFSQIRPIYELTPGFTSDFAFTRSKEDVTAASFLEFSKSLYEIKTTILKEIISFGFTGGLYLNFDKLIYYLVNIKLSLLPRLFSIDDEILYTTKKQALEEKRKFLKEHTYLEKKTVNTLNQLQRIGKQSEEISTIEYLIKTYLSIVSDPINLDPVNLERTFSELVKIYEILDEELSNLIESLLVNSAAQQEKIVIISIILIVILTIIASYLILKGFLTAHFKILANKFRNLAEGKFIGKKIAEHEDELGTLAKIYNNIVSSMQVKMKHIDKLRNQIGDIDLVLEENIIAQKKILLQESLDNNKIRSFINTITQSKGSHDHNKISLIMTAEKVNIERETKEKIDAIKKQNEILQAHSVSIITKLKTILNCLQKSSALVNIIKKIGEQSQLLFVNSAIEASVGEDQRMVFQGTVDKLERLSLTSKEAAKEILNKLVNMETTTNQLLHLMNVHSSNSTAVSKELNSIHDYFNYISLEVEKNWDIFMNAHDTLDDQLTGIEEAFQYLNEIVELGRDTEKYILKIYEASKKINGAETIIDSVLKGFEYD